MHRPLHMPFSLPHWKSHSNSWLPLETLQYPLPHTSPGHVDSLHIHTDLLSRTDQQDNCILLRNNFFFLEEKGVVRWRWLEKSFPLHGGRKYSCRLKPTLTFFKIKPLLILLLHFKLKALFFQKLFNTLWLPRTYSAAWGPVYTALFPFENKGICYTLCSGLHRNTKHALGKRSSRKTVPKVSRMYEN